MPVEAPTESLITIDPFESTQSHWDSITANALRDRLDRAGDMSGAIPTQDNFIPLFDGGTPSLLQKAGTTLRRFAAPVLVTDIAIGGAAGAIVFDINSHHVFDQQASPSAGASTEPIQPAANPTPEPLPSLTPCGPDGQPIQAVIGDKTIALPSSFPLESAAPSTEPSALPSFAPDASPTPDPETAANPCPSPEIPLPDEKQVLSSVLNQPKSEIRDINANELKTILNQLWTDFPDQLNSFIVPYDVGDKPMHFTEKYFKSTAFSVVTNSKKQPDERASWAGGSMALLLTYYHYSEDPIIKTRVIDAVDALKEYTIKYIKPDLETSRDEIAAAIENYSSVLLDYYLSLPSTIS